MLDRQEVVINRQRLWLFLNSESFAYSHSADVIMISLANPANLVIMFEYE